jgi:urea transport system permease protein
MRILHDSLVTLVRRLSSLAPASLAFVLIMLTVGLPAHAGPLDDALTGFTTDSFTDTQDTITTIVESGDPLALDIVGALEDSRLLFSAEAKKVFYKDANDTLFDAATGKAATGTPPGDLSPVRLNNRLRGTLSAAKGTLTLMAPTASARLDAAQSVFKSRQASTLPALDKALAREKDPAIKKTMMEARASIILSMPDAAADDQIAAITALYNRGDEDSLVILRALPADLPANVKQAATTAMNGLQERLAMWATAQNLWYGLSLASVLLLAAIGLAITFGVMGVINMAHGEMVMLGAYTTYVIQQFFVAHFPGAVDYALIVATPAAFLVAGAFGIAIERGIIRHLYGRPLETLLATWGLSLILQQLVRTVFGPTNRDVGAPSWMSGAFQVGQLSITYNRLWIIVFTIVVFVALLGLLRYTRFGLEMRAVVQNRTMASAMGIRTGRVDALTFGLGSGIAGIAGVALAHIDNVSPNLGKAYIIDSFMVVVFGGVGNLWGTLVGALSLGIANKFLEPFAGAVLGKIVILVLIILFIQKRPRGLFALKGRALEA